MHATTYALDSTWRPLLKDLGVPAGEVLRRAGLPEDLLSRSPVQAAAGAFPHAPLRLEAADFHRFWDSLGVQIADPLFPLRLCQGIRSEAFSPPLFAALCSPNFRVAAQRIARYKPLVAPMRLDLRDEGERVVLGLVWPDAAHPPPVTLVLTELLFFVALARMGTREPLQPLVVTTPVPPSASAADAYAQFLGVRIRRGPRHELVFSRADSLRPFLTSNEGLWKAFEPELRTRLAALDASVRMGQRVRSALLEALPSGLVAMDAVARKLAVSRRTLQRHLASEGQSYVKLLQETRQALAQHYLEKTALTAAEISFLLGFEEPNSFYRAFRGWTGETPQAVRTRARLPG